MKRLACLVPAAILTVAQTAMAAPLELEVARTATVKNAEFKYVLDVALAAAAPTRIGIDGLLDLTDLQRQLPDLLKGKKVLDICSATVSIEDFAASAAGETVIGTGHFGFELFDCNRTQPDQWQRGPVKETRQSDFRAEMTAFLRDDCAVVQIEKMDLGAPPKIGPIDFSSERIQAAGELIVEAADLVLADLPFCPKLPEEVELLDPVYDSGSPHEIGDGGLGLSLTGSIDVSTSSIIEVLKLLQKRDVLPPAP